MNWIKSLFGGGSGGNTSPPERIAPPLPDPDTFWTIIGKTTGVPQEERAAALAGELRSLEPDALITFDADYRRALAQAYRWDLWAAAYVINGGCSDDGFDYFCDWLISKGRGTFEAALADPASLISVVKAMEPDEDPDFEDFRYTVQTVFEEKTGDTMPYLDMNRPSEPTGEPWDEDAADAMYPKLAEWAHGRD